MADFYASVWSIFLQEVDEQLAEIELCLLQNITDMPTIFRCFHTLKGSFTAAGFEQLSHLAHTCEDVLGFFRDQKQPLNQSSKMHLQDALLFFRTALKQIEKDKTEPEVNTDLLKKLKQSSTEPQKNEKIAEENYVEFIEKARLALPALALSLKKEAQLQHLPQILLPFQQAAKQQGFQSLENTLLYIVELSQQPARELVQLWHAVAQCFEQIHTISRQFNFELSLVSSLSLAKSLLAMHWQETFSLFASEASFEVLDQETLLSLLKHLDILLPLVGGFALQKNFRYLAFLLEKQDDKAIRLSLSACLFSLKDLEAVSQEKTQQLIQQHVEQLQAALQTQLQNSQADEELKARLLQQHGLAENSLQGLSSKQWQILRDADEKAHAIFELNLDFSHQNIAEQVLASLRQQAQIVHSITLFYHQEQAQAEHTSVRFLCTSQLSLDELKQLLREQDPDQLVFLSDLPLQEKTTVEESFDAVKELSQGTSQSLHTIKVNSQSIDTLIDQIALLQVEFNRLSRYLDNKTEQLFRSVDEPGKQTMRQWQAQLQELQQKMEQAIKKAQESSLQLRVVRLDFALRRFYSFVSRTASQLGKQARFEIVGGDTLIDKSMVDVLAEPLAHLIRNAIDHGIEQLEERKKRGKPEQGLIELVAKQQRGKIVINVCDDGAGLDTEAIYQRAVELDILQANTHYPQSVILQQIFFPGFTMAKTLSQYSGRGVGMDVVKNSIVNAGGTISVYSQKGQGVNVQLQLPVSAVIQKVLLVRLNQQLYAIPESWIKQVLPCDKREQRQLVFENILVPIYSISELFNVEQQRANTELIILQHEDYQIAIAVEEVVGQVEMLLKNKQDYLQNITGIAAASVLDDGSIALLVDGLGLFQLALGDQIHGLKAL